MSAKHKIPNSRKNFNTKSKIALDFSQKHVRGLPKYKNIVSLLSTMNKPTNPFIIYNMKYIDSLQICIHHKIP